jgi:Antitoxin ParD
MTEDEKLAMAELKALLAPRIEEMERGEFSTQPVDEIFDEVMQEEESKEA